MDKQTTNRQYGIVWGGMSDGVYDKKTGDVLYSAMTLERIGFKWHKFIGMPQHELDRLIPQIEKVYRKWLAS